MVTAEWVSEPRRSYAPYAPLCMLLLKVQAKLMTEAGFCFSEQAGVRHVSHAGCRARVRKLLISRFLGCNTVVLMRHSVGPVYEKPKAATVYVLQRETFCSIIF